MMKNQEKKPFVLIPYSSIWSIFKHEFGQNLKLISQKIHELPTAPGYQNMEKYVVYIVHRHIT